MSLEQPASHEWVYELLPWYVNGTLEESERELIETHVRTCLVCRQELKKERELRELVRSAPTVDLSPRAAFDRLSRTLDARPGRHDGAFAKPRRWGRLHGRSASRLAVAAVVLAASAALLWSVLPPPATHVPEYSTLTSAGGVGNDVDVIFADHVGEAGIRVLLGEINATIVEGPSEIGRFTLRFEDPTFGEDRVSAVIRALNEDDRIRFAGPATPPDAAQ